MTSGPWTHGNRLIGYDSEHRRLWIGGQRVHHGMTGLLLAAAGTVLMAHDWKDRPSWFARGVQDDPDGRSLPGPNRHLPLP